MLFISLFCAISIMAQDYSSDVKLLKSSGNEAVFVSSAAEEKGKDAEEMAVRSVFNALFHEGVEGLNGGTPMVGVERKDYDYRFHNTKRYLNYLVGKPVKLDKVKYGGRQHQTFEVAVNIAALKKDLVKNEVTLHPSWADAKKEDVSSAISPVIVVVPYVKDSPGGFEDARALMDSDIAVKTAVEELNSRFSARGYKTRDFLTALQNSKTDDLLREGTQTDLKTMVVQQLPGDIVVTVDLSVNGDGATNQCNVSLKAVERQTEGVLAAENFTSGRYHVKDGAVLAKNAIDQIDDSFFNRLAEAFAGMVKTGRQMNLELTLSEGVTDWDFDSESPATGDDFKETLEEWLRSKAFGGRYDMSLSTDKFIKASINLPLWDQEKGRTFRITNFTSALKRFLRDQLGDGYKPAVTSLGQRVLVTVE